MDGRTDRPSYGDPWTHLKRRERTSGKTVAFLWWWNEEWNGDGGGGEGWGGERGWGGVRGWGGERGVGVEWRETFFLSKVFYLRVVGAWMSFPGFYVLRCRLQQRGAAGHAHYINVQCKWQRESKLRICMAGIKLSSCFRTLNMSSNSWLITASWLKMGLTGQCGRTCLCRAAAHGCRVYSHVDSVDSECRAGCRAGHDCAVW